MSYFNNKDIDTSEIIRSRKRRYIVKVLNSKFCIVDTHQDNEKIKIRFTYDNAREAIKQCSGLNHSELEFEMEI